MRTVLIENYYDFDSRKWLKILVIGGKIFDWNVEAVEIEKAAQACQTEEEKKALHANIQEHFLHSLSVFMNRRVTLKEINEAIAKGEIND